MSFSDSEITEVIGTLPAGAFNGAEKQAVRAWIDFVLEVDPKAKEKHDAFFYISTARLLAESIGTVCPSDLEDEHMRQMIISNIKANEIPYASEQNGPWKDWKVSPAQVTFALRVQGKCQKQAGGCGPGEAQGADPALSSVTGALKELAEAQTAVLNKGKPKGLSFNLKERVKELGLQDLPKDALPSEEVLERFEAAGKIARDKGRLWVGSTEGEDLHVHHRPKWSRAPVVDAVVGAEGSFEDRVKQALEVSKKRTMADKIDYPGFASFLGHLLEWGTKVMLLKGCTLLDLHGYIFNLTKIAEEKGGVRTAFQYDILNRMAMAKAVEDGEQDISKFFREIDRDTVKEAKDTIEKKYAEVGKAMAKQTSKGGCKASSWTAPSSGSSSGKDGGKGWTAPSSGSSHGKDGGKGWGKAGKGKADWKSSDWKSNDEGRRPTSPVRKDKWTGARSRSPKGQKSQQEWWGRK